MASWVIAQGARVAAPDGTQELGREVEVEGEVERPVGDVARGHRRRVPDLAEDERVGAGLEPVLKPRSQSKVAGVFSSVSPSSMR